MAVFFQFFERLYSSPRLQHDILLPRDPARGFSFVHRQPFAFPNAPVPEIVCGLH